MKRLSLSGILGVTGIVGMFVTLMVSEFLNVKDPIQFILLTPSIFLGFVGVGLDISKTWTGRLLTFPVAFVSSVGLVSLGLYLDYVRFLKTF